MESKVIYDRKKTAISGKSAPVSIEIYFDRNTRIWRNLPFKIEKEHWDDKKKRVTRQHNRAIQYNFMIEAELRKIEEFNLDCFRYQITPSPESLKLFMDGDQLGRNTSLAEYMRQQFEIDKPTLGAGQIRAVNSVLNNFEAFDKHVKIQDFNLNYLHRFHSHLLKTMKASTTLKNHKVLIKYLRRAVNTDMIKKTPYDNFKLPKAKSNIDFLTVDEIQRLRDYKGIQRLEQVRDMFIFQINSGLAFGDLLNLKRDEIRNIDGRPFIIRSREKTQEKTMVPLLEEALQIIEKYRDNNSKVFNIISNQKMNAFLKELEIICDIPKTLTTHLARHTFATQMLNAGLPLETVSHTLGHASVKTTRIYAQMLSSKISNDYDRLGITKI
ncbi:MAG: site-specific integrase [Bacteroidetes bacterium]|nr:site-specific integrase [Bacteroidota bacterium]